MIANGMGRREFFSWSFVLLNHYYYLFITQKKGRNKLCNICIYSELLGEWEGKTKKLWKDQCKYLNNCSGKMIRKSCCPSISRMRK